MALEEVCQDLTLVEREAAKADLLCYLQMLRRWGERTNLVSSRDRDAVCERHLIPSLLLRPSLLAVRHGSVLDLGSGAGFPGVPLAVTTQKSRFTLVESRRRRASFLRAVVRELSLENSRVVNARIENWHPVTPADVALARSLARPSRVTDLVKHALAPDGFLLVTLPPDAGSSEDGGADGRRPRHALWQPFAEGRGAVDIPMERRIGP